MGTGTELFGSLRARGDIDIGDDAVIHGDVSTRGGAVTLGPGVNVRGDVACEDAVIHQAAEVEGSIRARGDLQLVDEVAMPGAEESDETSADVKSASLIAGENAEAGEPAEPEAEMNSDDLDAEHVCAECGRTFDSQQGLAGHSNAHN
jgi:cytoskeletal protein CcmA (bactofilin family)